MNIDAIASLSDEHLCDALERYAGNERYATARLVAALGELDRRRLFLAQGYTSLFAYCTQALHLGEGAAYTRMEVARAARRWPLILDLLADGSVNLATVRILVPHLTDDNHRELLKAATNKSKREVERQMAALRPLPAAPSFVRKLPATTTTASSLHAAELHPLRENDAELAVPIDRDCTASPLAPPSDEPVAAAAPVPPHPHKTARITPLAPERFKVQFTLSRDSYDRLTQAQDLLRHVIPNGDPAAIFERALRLLVADLQRKKFADTSRPRSAMPCTTASRHIPASVRREVWKRDGGQCAFVGPAGPCGERGFLEFHHQVPFAHGGPTTASNLSLRCRSHNQYEAESVFGPMISRETGANDWLDARSE